MRKYYKEFWLDSLSPTKILNILTMNVNNPETNNTSINPAKAANGEKINMSRRANTNSDITVLFMIYPLKSIC